MNRRNLLALLGGSGLLPRLPRPVQAADRVWRIGYLDSGAEVVRRPLLAAFGRRMRELGYIEGGNLVYETRFGEGQFDRLPRLAQELLGWHPDALLAATTPATGAIKGLTSTVPIVIVAVADPVGTGLVQSLARPGGNLTGISTIIVELTGKRLEIIKEIVPSASRIAVLANPDGGSAASQLREAAAAAVRLNIDLQPILDIRSAADAEPAVAAAVAAGAGAAIHMVDALPRKQTIEAAAKYRLPVVYPLRSDAEAGGLVIYGADLTSQFGQAADLMHKILKGANPAQLPVEQPTKFELIINLKTAKTLGLTVPQSILARADEVIE